MEAVRFAVRREITEFDAFIVEPLTIGMRARPIPFDLLVGNHAPLFEVDQEHPAGLQPAFRDDVLRIYRQHTDFARP